MTLRRIVFLCILFIINIVICIFYMQPLHFRYQTVPSVLNETEYLIEASIHTIMHENSTNETSPDNYDATNSAFPPQFNFTLNPSDICSIKNRKKLGKFTVIILVCSSVPNFEQREQIRNTWGSVALFNNSLSPARLAFLVGATSNMTLQQEIERESSQHHDIIQQSFIDSYRNLTLKSIMLLKWTSEFCSNVQYVMKTDDDMYVNVKNLVSALVRFPVRSNAMYGCLFKRAKPDRNSKSKWYVPKSQYDNDVFPDYLSGTGYVISRDVVPRLLEASAILPFLVMEDVFITGLCANQAQVKRYNTRGFAYWKRAATGCAFKDVLTGHHVSVSDMGKIWRELHKKNLNCRKPKKN